MGSPRPPPPPHKGPRAAAARQGPGGLDRARRQSPGPGGRRRAPFLPQRQLPQPPQRAGDPPPPGPRRGGRPPRHRGGAAAGDGLPSDGPHVRPRERKRVSASCPPAVARGPPPDGASLNLKASMPGYGEHPCFGSSPDPGFPGGKGEIRRFPRVTGLPPGRDTVMSVMRRGRPGAAAPEARPLPVEQAARPVPDLRHPGLAGPVSRHVRADGETRTLRNTPRRTVAAPTTPDRPTPTPPCADTRFPEPCSRPAIRRAHPEPAAHAARQKQLPACRQIS